MSATAAAAAAPAVIGGDAAPSIRGRLRRGVALAPTTWFRAGGVADWLARPADEDDLVALLRDHPVTVLGAASNVIVRDGGIPGITVRLPFAAVVVETDGIVAGAAALDGVVAEHAAAAGLGGLEFLCGIPGSVGGAVAMNAGAYGADVAAVLDWAEIATPAGVARQAADTLGFGYRHAALPRGSVVTRARFRAVPGNPVAIAARMAAIRAEREATQPVRARTGGSTFRNPPGARAWALIDAAGCRGLVQGGAQVSEKHANFLLNTGDATAADLEQLGETVRARVHQHAGVVLEWEIKRLGVRAP